MVVETSPIKGEVYKKYQKRTDKRQAIGLHMLFVLVSTGGIALAGLVTH